MDAQAYAFILYLKLQLQLQIPSSSLMMHCMMCVFVNQCVVAVL